LGSWVDVHEGLNHKQKFGGSRYCQLWAEIELHGGLKKDEMEKEVGDKIANDIRQVLIFSGEWRINFKSDTNSCIQTK